MKKFKILLVVLIALLILPFGVFADEGNNTEDAVSQEVKLYFFHGDGCGFCAKASAWFEEIEEEYGDKFEVVAYEVWKSAENAELMEAVANVRKETVNGVPYIIIGNQSWNGFDDDYKESILSKIESEYEQDPEERYDVMNYVVIDSDEKEDNTARDVLILLVLVGVVAAVSVGVVVARKNTN